MRARLLAVALAALAALLTTSGSLDALQLRATAEPPPQLIGTWRLNVAKSKYSPGPPLRAETRVYTKGPDGVKGVASRTHGEWRDVSDDDSGLRGSTSSWNSLTVAFRASRQS